MVKITECIDMVEALKDSVDFTLVELAKFEKWLQEQEQQGITEFDSSLSIESYQAVEDVLLNLQLALRDHHRTGQVSAE